MSEATVLVVEHDPRVAELERLYLAREGFQVHCETDPGRAPGAVSRLRPDVVVLDLSTAHADLYRQVAAAAAPAPVVCVVAGDAEAPGEHKVARPFGPRVLIAAVAAALRTREDGDPQAGVLRSGALTLDTGGRTVVAGDREPALTATEFDLLAFLLCTPGRVFTREQLLAAVWGSTGSAGTRTVDVHIAQLRAKLRDASPIRTVRGVGYAAGE